MIVKSGSREAGATLYCAPVFCHPFDGFVILVAVLHYGPSR